jgi:hypothetical protein
MLQKNSQTLCLSRKMREDFRAVAFTTLQLRWSVDTDEPRVSGSPEAINKRYRFGGIEQHGTAGSVRERVAVVRRSSLNSYVPSTHRKQCSDWPLSWGHHPPRCAACRMVLHSEKVWRLTAISPQWRMSCSVKLNAEIFNIKVGGTYRYHCDWNS